MMFSTAKNAKAQFNIKENPNFLPVKGDTAVCSDCLRLSELSDNLEKISIGRIPPKTEKSFTPSFQGWIFSRLSELSGK